MKLKLSTRYVDARIGEDMKDIRSLADAILYILSGIVAIGILASTLLP